MSASIVIKGKSRFALLQTEGRRTWESFEKTTARIPGFDEFKSSGYFYSLDGAADGANIYTYFPFLFAEAFPEVTTRQLRKLSLMSLLCLYHILVDDVLMDEEKPPSKSGILVSNALLLRSLEILDDVTAGNPIPWKPLRRLHADYSTATLLEGNHRNAFNRYEKRDLFRILSAKSAMAKLVLLTLCSISGRSQALKPLSRSLDLYYLGDQLFDDFRDWKKDLRAGRYSYLLTTVITSCKVQVPHDPAAREQTIERVGKYFYLSGIAENYLTEVIEYWRQAADCGANLGCKQWSAFLESLQMGARRVRSSVSESSRRLLLQNDRYRYSLAPALDPGQTGATHPVKAVSPTALESARRATEFIRRQRRPGVGFEDFVVFGEKLSVWINAYVGMALGDWMKLGSARARRTRLLDETAAVLARSRRDDGWATNDSAPPDADTTAWALLFLERQENVDRKLVERGAISLLEYQRADGGFATYLRKSTGAYFKGYCASHVEVAATAVAALRAAAPEAASDAIARAVRYIREHKESDGLWQGYWWDGRMYATYHCLKACPPSSDLERKWAACTILDRQESEGCFGGDTVGKNRVFETAFGLKCLLFLDPSLAESEPIRNGVAWLMNYQEADGSFDSAPMMRVPAVDDERPWEQREWKLDLLDGTNLIIRDQNRLFTTASVLSCLVDFISIAGDYRLIVTSRPDRQNRQEPDSSNKTVSSVQKSAQLFGVQ
jgi:squalene-hopene/tetraprenyl-beta-curcumene cyclase